MTEDAPDARPGSVAWLRPSPTTTHPRRSPRHPRPRRRRRPWSILRWETRRSIGGGHIADGLAAGRRRGAVRAGAGGGVAEEYEIDPALPRLLSRLSVFLPTMEAIRSSVNGDFRPVGSGSCCPPARVRSAGREGAGAGVGGTVSSTRARSVDSSAPRGSPRDGRRVVEHFSGGGGSSILRSTRRYS